MRFRLSAILLGLAASAAAIEQPMSKSDEQWLEREAAPIATSDEASLYRSLPSEADRERFREIFWKRRDPVPATPENEFLEDYRERVALADSRFRARVGPGSQSEMGQLFLLLGFPLSVDTGRTVVQLDAGRGDGIPESLEGSATEEPSAAGGASGASQEAQAAGSRVQTWVYAPNEALGIPDGLEVKFRAQPGYGYRLVRTDDVDSLLEMTRRATVARPDVDYRLDEDGHLLPLETELPSSRGSKVLDDLIATGAGTDDVSFAVTPSFFESHEGEVYVPLLFEADDAGVSFEGDEALLTFLGAVADETGVRHRFEEQARLRRGAIAFEVPLQLGPGDYIVYLGIVDEASGRSGSRLASLSVPRFDAGALDTSSIVLHAGAERSDASAGVPGNAFQFGGIRLAPRASRPFRSEESLGIFFFVYGVGTDGSGESKLTAQYRFLLDGEEKAQTRPQPLLSGSARAMASDEIPLESFAPGEYQLLVTVKDEVTGSVVERRTTFRIEG